MRRSPWATLAVIALALIGLNAVLRILGVQIRISVIGSIVLSLIVGAIVAGTRR